LEASPDLSKGEEKELKNIWGAEMSSFGGFRWSEKNK
jgi:hypothetical protein